MPLSPGDRLGPYEIIAPIGKGGMGEVWKALDPRLNRIVAIKRLRGQHTARFQQEAHAIAALNHPNICQIHDIGPDYLVMEYIEGKPLSGPLPVEHALKLAVQIASAMEEAHSKGILHRDLKPANILVTVKGSAKLLDFGLAKLTTESDPDGTQTIEGTILGTAAYMSPEQAQGRPLDERSDIFSFGTVLYELLSGRPPFTGSSTVEVLSAVLRDEPAPLNAPSSVAEVVKRCLAKRAADRFASVTELETALDRIVAKPPTQDRPSIAVLPFANMSAEKDSEYFSDGLAEEIINALAQIPGLKVTARTSAFAFRGKEQDIRKIAKALGVATILEGSVRRAGSSIRVTAQLINAADGYHLWSERYDRELTDVFKVQDEIAQAIASALHVKLSGAPPLAQQYKPSLPAYEAYLKARYYIANFRPDLLPRVKECYEQAIALDPKFALAHCEYGAYFLLMVNFGVLPANQGLPMMRALAQKALELDPSLPEGQAMLGHVAAFLEFDWKEAERCIRLAMVREPVSLMVRLIYALVSLLALDRAPEAVQQLERALQEDPLNSTVRSSHAGSLVWAGRYEDASKAYREILEFNPAMPIAWGSLGIHHLLRGELDQALTLIEKAYSLAPTIPNGIGALAGLLMRAGDTRRAEELLQKLQASDAYGAPRGLAVYHWVLREFDRAADWFEKAIDQHDPGVLLMLRQWYGRELRSTPRWAGLMRKLNLPES